jgi:restriction system protein
MGGTLVGVLQLGAIAALAVVAYKLWVNLSTRLGRRQKIAAAIRKHTKVLARKRLQTVRTDDYGKVVLRDWHKEIRAFVDSEIASTLTKREARLLNDRWDSVVDQIDSAAQRASRSLPAGSFSASMSPTDFEHFCADRIREAGWDAKVTRRSGDQGADIIAEREGTRLVLQCKLYSQPVGNKAVQEVIAAKTYEGAQHAAVVSNSNYTKSAQRLAATAGVRLLHYSDLPTLTSLASNRSA